MNWRPSNQSDPKALALADKHYSRVTPGSKGFMPAGRQLVLLTDDADALWGTSYPYPHVAMNKWREAFVCCIFRNESIIKSSTLIREACAATRHRWGTIPRYGMITFVDPNKTRRKRDPGRCFLRAGFEQAPCPLHEEKYRSCCYCKGLTYRGLVALWLPPCNFPEPASLIR